MIQRYDLVCEYEANIGPLDDGDYVAYADHLAELTAERERADRAEAEIARRHGIGGELIIARRERDEAHNELAALRERVERAVAALECGHPASLMLHSAETGEPLYCELCDMRSQRNDAVQMEEHYKAERDALRERVARLVGVIEAAPHGAGCLFGLKATASMFYHCNCWKRTALGDK